MGVKFAGSRSLDERRRRRLVGENERASAATSELAPHAGFWKIQPVQTESEDALISPLQSLIPLSRLKIWGLCMTVPLIGLLLVLIAQAGTLISDQKIRAVFDLQQGHLWRFICGVLFLGSAGLCWLISWFRSASDRDFEGCFKSWYFSGWIFLFFGFIAGCDAHLVFSQMLGNSARIEGAFLRTLIWTVPMSAFLIEPMRCFVREMWQCRRSFFMMTLCCLASLAFMEMQLPVSEQTALYTSQTSQIIILATSVLVPALVFSALLSQMHYVMYVSSDPVPRRQSWTLIAIAWGKQKLFIGLSIAGSYCFSKLKMASSFTHSRGSSQFEKMKNARAQRRTKREFSKQNSKTDSAAQKTVAASGPVTKAVQQKQSPQRPVKPTAFKQVAADQHKKRPPANFPESVQASHTKQQDIQQTPVIANHHSKEETYDTENRFLSAESDHVDPSNLKGLSKKERRRIRKLHREQQRAKAG